MTTDFEETLRKLEATHDTATLTVEEVGALYFGLSRPYARRMAAEGRFPVPCFQAYPGRKAPYLVLLVELARHLVSSNEARA